jgi:uncharacterized protein YecE (DUF72 family)
MAGTIRVGIGGWTFEPWRDGVFYPKGLPQSQELEYASRRLTVIEINGTFYRTQSAASFAKWRDATPEVFVFSMKALRFATHRRVLAEAGESVRHFVGSGIAELGPKLGPIVWQLPPTKRFEPQDLEAFVRLLPPQVEGLPLRHVLDVRHASFACREYVELARRHRIATVFTDSTDYASFADLTGDFVYARIMRTDATLEQGCTPEALAQVAACARVWAAGSEPAGLPRVVEPPPPQRAKRDVFLLFIAAAKQKAPAAAMGVIECLGQR